MPSTCGAACSTLDSQTGQCDGNNDIIDALSFKVTVSPRNPKLKIAPACRDGRWACDCLQRHSVRKTHSEPKVDLATNIKRHMRRDLHNNANIIYHFLLTF
eukprot:TRINITY_DN96157_c0_g1_i1.p1 TRINITY_DN96157_c0_g1~~TRINITY_DN96157_c0_g1_i1.p1  ORF type:complete len:101 (+),score=5.73 TRINITY_DN96157_c0_g1_i1:271-573(+)